MTRSLLMAALLTLMAASASAQQRAELMQAKSYFNAGAAAYEMGDYAAAIQALEAAYRITPLPAIAFSLAQAERRQYFVSREPQHLSRAIELYRAYLQKVESGGRRADATDALAQLEPLAALSAQVVTAPEPQPDAAADKTRLMISCSAPQARVALDAAEGVASPAIVRVEPGMHQVRVSAPGYFDVERSVEAVAGELIPIEVELRERPASVLLRSEPEAELHVDGSPAGSVGAARTLSLPGGSHTFGFARNGHHARLIRAQLAPGDSREIAVRLEPTAQRTAAITLFVVGGAGLVAGGVFSAFALEREDAADDALSKRQRANLSPDELVDYNEAKRDRNRWRVAAITSFGVALAAGVTGLFLYALDQPELQESGAELHVALPIPGAAQDVAVTGRLRF
ncbi:MAG TPA: PEGA domain-containing protein [Polyangiales bacterium]|nr:PEGA domain-containing protein [Polyangiales bacterium]